MPATPAPRLDGLRPVKTLVQGVRANSRMTHCTPNPLILSEPLIATEKPFYVWDQPSPGMTRLISHFSVYPAADVNGACWLFHEDVSGGYASAYWSPHETRLEVAQGLEQLVSNLWGTNIANKQQVVDAPRISRKGKLRWSNSRSYERRCEFLSEIVDPNYLRVTESLPLFQFSEMRGEKKFDTAIYPAWLVGERRWFLVAKEALEAPTREPEVGEYVISHAEVIRNVLDNRATLLDPIFAKLLEARAS